MPSTLCSVCSNEPEDIIRLFMKCDVATRTWNAIFIWLDINNLLVSSLFDLASWLDSLTVNRWKKVIIESIVKYYLLGLMEF